MLNFENALAFAYPSFHTRCKLDKKFFKLLPSLIYLIFINFKSIQLPFVIEFNFL